MHGSRLFCVLLALWVTVIAVGRVLADAHSNCVSVCATSTGNHTCSPKFRYPPATYEDIECMCSNANFTSTATACFTTSNCTATDAQDFRNFCAARSTPTPKDSGLEDFASIGTSVGFVAGMGAVVLVLLVAFVYMFCAYRNCWSRGRQGARADLHQSNPRAWKDEELRPPPPAYSA